MIKFLDKIPQEPLYVAYSGGVDSTAALTFISRKRNVTALFFHHGTNESEKAKEHCINFCKKHDIKLLIGHITREKNSKESWEEFWRKERYEFFMSFLDPVITAHNLDDCVETWIFSSLHGQSKLMPYRHKNVVRPFLITRKDDFKQWCLRQNYEWIEDESNKDVRFMRNQIRHNIVPEALKVNPGLHKVIFKKLIQRQKELTVW